MSIRDFGARSVNSGNGFLNNIAAGSFAFFWRPNVAVGSDSVFLSLLPFQVDQFIQKSSNNLRILVSNLDFTYPISIGNQYHIGISCITPGTSILYINGLPVFTSTSGSGFQSGNGPISINPNQTAGLDFHLDNMAGWNTQLTNANFISLAGGADPATIGTPVANYTFNGTNPNQVTAGDAGLTNLGSQGSAINFSSLSGNGNAIWSSDTLSVSNPTQMIDQYLTRNGLVVFRMGGSFSSFQIDSNSNALYSKSIQSIAMNTNGSGYTAPTASVSGGNPVTGSVNLVNVYQGSNYTFANITISPPDQAGGVQATATAIIVGGSVTSSTMTNQGSGYIKNPFATVVGDGFGAGFMAYSNYIPAVLGTPLMHGNGSIYGIPIAQPGIGYTSPITITISDLTGNGATATALLGGPPQVIAAVNASLSPTFSVNGSNATINPQTIWLNSSLNMAVPMFQFPSASTPTNASTVTVNASAGWATIASGPAPALTNAALTNYVGLLEPQMATTPGACQVGANQGTAPSYFASPVPMTANMKWRMAAWNNGGTINTNSTTHDLISWTAGSPNNLFWQGASGAPLPTGPTCTLTNTNGTGFVGICNVVNGSINSISVSNSGGNYNAGTIVTIVGGAGWNSTGWTVTLNAGGINSVVGGTGGAGYNDGLWKVQWDDTTPVNGSATTVLSYALADSNNYLNSVSSLNNAGTVVNGVLTGVRNVFYLQRKPAQAYNDVEGVQLVASGGQNTNGVFFNTSQNVILLGPNNNDFTNTLATDANVAKWNVFPNGRTPPCFRPMSALDETGGVALYHNVTDIPQTTDNTWSVSQYNIQSAAYVRPYDVSRSPNLYLNLNQPEAVAPSASGPTNYAVNPPNTSFMNISNPPSNNNVICWEMVYNSNHNGFTGQQFTIPNGPPFMYFTQGATGTTAFAPIAYNFNLVNFPFDNYVTSNTTMVGQVAYSNNNPGADFTSSSMPNFLNQVAFTQGVTGSINANQVRTVTLNTNGTNYGSGTAIVFSVPPLGSQTALATCTLNGGVVNSATMVPSFNGTGYTSPVRVYASTINSNVKRATGVCSISNGSVTGVTVSSQGEWYSGTEGMTIIGGGGSGATGTLTFTDLGSGNHQVNSVVLTGGGTNYAYPPQAWLDPPAGTAILNANVVAGSVNSLSIVTGGGNYTTPPPILIDPPGLQAYGSLSLVNGSVNSATVLFGGTNYFGTIPEVTIFGTGNGATVTAGVTGGVVTGLAVTNSGNNYTGTNPACIMIAPPPRCAIANLSVVNGVMQSDSSNNISMLDPGHGFGVTPPTASIVNVGNGTGSTLGAVGMSWATNSQIQIRQQGFIPTKAAAAYSQNAGADFWCNIPQPSSPALVNQMVDDSCAATLPGTLIYYEYNNETWNAIFFEKFYQTIGQTISGNAHTAYASMLCAFYDLIDARMALNGRSADCRHVAGVQAVGYTTSTLPIIQYVCGKGKRIDVICGDGYVDCPGDGPIVSIFASAVSASPLSVNHGTSWQTTYPWTLEQLHDWLRHWVLNDQSQVGSNLAGQMAGLVYNQIAAITTYTLASGQTTPPAYVNYEAIIQQMTPGGIDTSGSLLATGLLWDLFYTRGHYDTTGAYFQGRQNAGIKLCNVFQLANGWDSGNPGKCWNMGIHACQNPGLGDGSDGKFTNYFWTQGWSVAGPGTSVNAFSSPVVQADRFNVAPALLAWQNWGSLAGTNPQPPSRLARTYPGVMLLCT